MWIIRINQSAATQKTWQPRMSILLVLSYINKANEHIYFWPEVLHLFQEFAIFETMLTIWVGRRVAIVTIQSNLCLKPLVTHFTSVATMFGESMLLHCAFGPKP